MLSALSNVGHRLYGAGRNDTMKSGSKYWMLRYWAWSSLLYIVSKYI
jgi:hypothetical protein